MERRSTEVEVEDEILASNGSLPELKKNAKSVPKVCNEKHKQKPNPENKHSRDKSLPVLREN